MWPLVTGENAVSLPDHTEPLTAAVDVVVIVDVNFDDVNQSTPPPNNSTTHTTLLLSTLLSVNTSFWLII